MNRLAESLLDTARQNMGLAASAFVTAELRAIGQSRESLDIVGLRAVAARARGRSSRFMDDDAAQAFAAAVESLIEGDGPAVSDEAVDHQLALDAAASLLARGDAHRALAAYRDLAQRHRDAHSLEGLARAAAGAGDVAVATEALRDAAVLLVQQGERDRATAVLEAAVALAPSDLASHRRLSALYANTGDVTSSRCEHSRFVEACLAAGDRERALAEIEYARGTVGDAPALRELERRISSLPSPQVPSAPPRLVVVPRAEPEAVAPAPPVAPLPVVAAPPDIDLEQEAVTAADELLRTGKVRAAADVLLAHVARGLPGRHVQRMLIAVDRQLGRADIADEKCRLLSRLLELDGDRTGAVEVRRLAIAS